MESIELAGVVLLTQNIGEYDRRLVILTRERGKITAFARGARRSNSPLMAVCNPFVFARFTLYEGRSAYTLVRADVTAYFTELAAEQPEVYYGFYFLELASYFTREGIEAQGEVNLLFVALHALLKKKMDLDLIRRAFECRMLSLAGELREIEEGRNIHPAASYAVRYAATCDVRGLFSFSLEEEAKKDFVRYIASEMKRCVDRPLKTLAVIEAVGGG